MKKSIITIMIFVFNLGFSQVELPFFEQIAFNFYNDTIVEKHPSKKKIRISKYATDLHPNYYRFQVDKCLTGEFLDEKTNLQVLNSYVEKETNFDFYNQLMNYEGINKKQFRIRKSKTERYPYLRISQPYQKNNDLETYFVNIIEYHKTWSIEYFLQIDENGKIINWCKDKDIILSQYH